MNQEEVNNQFQQYVQSWIKEHGRSLMRAQAEGFTDQKSEVRPRLDTELKLKYHWFSPQQMYMMDNHPFEEGCAVQLGDMTVEEVFQSPMLRQAYHLLNTLAKKELILQSGCIPPSLVEELYEMGTHYTARLYIENFSESEVKEVRLVHGILRETGLINENSEILSITDMGKKALTDQNFLVHTVVTYLFKDFDTSRLDLQRNSESSNSGRVYTLWLLHNFGGQWHGLKFYEKEYLNAYPPIKGTNKRNIKGFITPSDMYTNRILKCMFFNLGILEQFLKFGDSGVKKTPLLDRMFTFEEPLKI